MLPFRRFAFSALLTLLITSFTTISFALTFDSTASSFDSIQLPLTFEQNIGQADDSVTFLSRSGGYTLYLTDNQAVFSLRQSTQLPNRLATQTVLTMALVGSNPSMIVSGEALQSGVSNYFIGNDPTQWQTNVPHYGAVHYRDVYAGIDLVYYGNDSELQYDLVVAPHTGTDSIRIEFAEAESLELDANGDLLINTSAGVVRQQAPFSYQEIDGTQVEVESAFTINVDNTVGFTLGNYDPNFELTIDPILIYSSAIGGTYDDRLVDMVLGDEGSIYVSGSTNSSDYPLATDSSPSTDAIITKINSNTGTLIYSIYVGGSGFDHIESIAYQDNRLFIAGITESLDFPLNEEIQNTLKGVGDGFVAVYNENTEQLDFSTYLGGDDYDEVRDLGLDASGNIIVAGNTGSSDFPTLNPFQEDQDGYDVFLSKFSTGNFDLVYSTYLGGSAFDKVRELIVTDSGDVYVVGTTLSDDFPVASAYTTSFSGGTSYGDIFLSHFDASGNTLLYSTYFGGSGEELFPSIAITDNNIIFLSGETRSADFPTQNAYLNSLGGVRDGFISSINPALSGSSSLLYSTYLGGAEWDSAMGISVINNSQVAVTGVTQSDNFPLMNATQATRAGATDAFLITLDSDQNVLQFGTFLGGSDQDYGLGIVTDQLGSVYVLGQSQSTDADSFVSRFALNDPGDCDGTPGDDDINCDTNPVNPENQVDGDLGDDFIDLSIVTVSMIDGDGLPGVDDERGDGDGGDDFIENSGTVNGVIRGDNVTGHGNHDFINNFGTVNGNIYGDDALGNGGHDWISNSNVVNGNIYGDGVGGYGGSDVIFNHDTVTGDIFGDVATGAGEADYFENHGTVGGTLYGDHGGAGIGGDDVFLNLGTVGANIEGEGGADIVYNFGTVEGAVLGGDGDDQIIFHPGFSGGADNSLAVDGGNGSDTLEFYWTFTDANAESQFTNVLDSANPANGSVTFDGQTVNFTNFEVIKHTTFVVDTLECSSGTVNDDVLVCSTNPPDPSSEDYFMGLAGNDTMTALPGVSISAIYGDNANVYESEEGNDVITNHGLVYSRINGGVGSPSFSGDTITNYGVIPAFLLGTIGNELSDFEDQASYSITNTSINYGLVSIIETFSVLPQPNVHVDVEIDNTLVNHGVITFALIGSHVYSDLSTGEIVLSGQTTIINHGRVMYGAILGGETDNVIINDGFLGGNSPSFVETFYNIDAGDGNDTVFITENSRGGTDHELLVDGGDGTDTLIFAMPNDGSPEYTQLLADVANATPVGGSITYKGETVTFTNFEAVQVDNPPQFCPDGTAGNDTIVCEVSPPVGTNGDASVHGGAGADNITVNEGVTVGNVFGEVNTNEVSSSITQGDDDNIINSGFVQNDIWGDGIPSGEEFSNGSGGDDFIHNTTTGQVVGFVAGDMITTYSVVNGNDTIINEGQITGYILGDVSSASEVLGGNDVLNNLGTVGGIAGDSFDTRQDGSQAGNDTITNTGLVVEDIYGDFVFEIENASISAGTDTIINSGIVNQNIYGDYVVDSDEQLTGEGAADIITNSGTVGGTIFAEGGDDIVILQDGANGGADNILPLDGGIGFDILRFEFTGLTQQQSIELLAADPANGSVTINGQTFTFVDFESIEVPNYMPGALTQIAPIGTITTAYGNPTYSWSDRNVAHYELYVARVDGTQIINPMVSRANICNGATCSIDLTTLAETNRLTNGAYQWYVREAGGVWVGPQAFTLNAPPPGLVTLGATSGLDNLKPTFHWTLSGDAINATYFNLYLQTSSGTPVFDQWFTRAATCGGVNGITCSMISPVELANGVQYQLYMRSYGPGGYSVGGPFNNGYGGPANFTVMATYPSPISPSGTVNLPLGNPTYTWTDIAGAEYYYLYVANVAGQQVINEVVSDVGYCNGTQCQIDATTLRESYRLPNGAYTFYVRGWKDNQATPWSGGMSFTVNSTLPGLVTKTFPLEGESTAYNTTFQWNEVADVSGYNLYLVDPNGGNSGILRGEVGDEVVCGAGVCGWNYTLASVPGTWTWYVQAFNSAGAGAWSVGGAADGYGGVTFTAPTAIPDLIAKVAPTQNQALTDSTVGFSWTPDNDATQYELYIVGPSGWVSDVTYVVGSTVTCATNCSVEVVLPYVGNYAWYLRGYNAAGWGKWSAGEAADGYGAQAFSVTDTLPSAVVKIAPTNAQNLDDLTVTFSWTPDAEATYYQSYVAGPNGFVSDRTLMVGTDVTCATTCDTTITLPVNGAYMWYLRGYSAAGWGAWSAGGAADNYGVVNFTVGQPLPGVIVKSAPIASATLTDANATFSWQPDANATKYEVSIVGPNGFSSYAPYVVGSGVTCTSSCALNIVLPANGAYIWYLRGGNAAGWGPWSAGEALDGYGAVTFTVNQPLSAVIAKISPAPSAVVNTLSGTFTWTPDANATKYEVYVAGPNGFVSNAPYVVGSGVTCTTDCVLDFTFPANGAYMWYVRGGNDAGWGAWSAGEAADGYGGVAFSVAQPLPGAATLLTPANDAVIYQTNRPTFTWNTVATATYYRLYVVNGMGLPVYDQWHTATSVCSSTCLFQLPNPLAFGGYTWQIQTYNITGVGALSATRSFLSLSFNLQPLMVQVENGAITRSGAWTQENSQSAVGQAYLQSSTSGADSLTMTFTGTQVDVVYVAGAEYGTFVVEIDGEPMRGVNANATQTAFGQIASFTDLTDGEHTLRIIPLGGSPVAIDALIMNGQVLTTQPVEEVPVETPVVIPVNPTDEAPISTPEPEVTDEVVIVPVQPEITPDVEVTAEP